MENKNYMKQVAEMLGVELDEKFKLKHKNGIVLTHEYKITNENALQYYNEIYKQWVSSDLLIDVLFGEYTTIKISKKDTKIFSVFPVSGKTYAAKKLTEQGYKVLDLDSSEYSHKYYNFSVAGCKVDRVKNPSFPENYIKAIKDAIGEYDFIFVSTHKEVRDALEKEKIKYYLVYPNYDMKSEWIGRCYLRGDNKEFCDKLSNNWDQWIEEWNEELDNVTYNNNNKIFLGLTYDTRYLYDAIKNYYI